MTKQTTQDFSALREEFWRLPDRAFADRSMAAAAAHLSTHALERLAMVGGGPPYTRVGRRSLYRISDVKAWLDSGSRGRTTAEHAEAVR